MAGLGEAASVIAVIQLSAKVASICVQYSREVKHAAKDIDRLQGELIGLQDLLQNVKQLLDGPNGARLSASPRLSKEIDGCRSELTALDQRLNPSKSRKAMSRVGFRALKWPFESKAVYEIIDRLERCKQSVSLSLQVDQTNLVIAVSHKLDLSKLPQAEGAEFDSYADELDARCHPETRVELRQQIKNWREDQEGKCIFWLCGVAGTGKSTISRTVAQYFADEGQLAASFFFKRGEGDRGNASRFFTTIARQMVVKIPSLSSVISEAIEADPSLPGKWMRDQFEKLILQPLSKLPAQNRMSRLVIVIDALDECEREGDIRNILHLLAQFQSVTSVSLRVFVTSRPELPIRLGFKAISGEAYQNTILHEISRSIIEHDIAAFLKHEFGKIRNDHDSLPSDWPGEKNLQALTDMAIPLFIFAATVCRFVGDMRWDPEEQLRIVLTYKVASQASNLDRTYRPILDRLLIDLTEPQKKTLIREFVLVIGTIILLANPLSVVSLARLLGLSERTVKYRLDSLHSVLNIPTVQHFPVRLLHLSFREFLIDPQKQENSPFWVDEKETHKIIATKCLELISESLKENICSLQSPGTLRVEIDRTTIDDNLPAEVQYACCHWVYHLEHGGDQISDHDTVHSFLSKHLLHWLEALSLVGRLHESLAMIHSLITLITPDNSHQVADLLFDTRRFILKHRSVIDIAPLQVYSSALVFTPKTSLVKILFKDNVPSCIKRLPEVESTWNAELQTLEGHISAVSAVVFSPDSQLLASASWDESVRLWDPKTGTTVQTLKGHTNIVKAVAFSPDGQLLASASNDNTVRLWDPKTGTTVQTLKGHTNIVTAVAFSPDGQLLASVSDDNMVRLWDPKTGATVQTIKGHTNGVIAVAFSPDGQLLASTSYDNTVRLWDPKTGATVQTLEGHTNTVTAVAFSPDGPLLASASNDSTVRLWDPKTGITVQTLKGHINLVTAVAFSPDGQLLASASYDDTVRLWDPKTGATVQTLKGHTDAVIAVAFSSDGQLLASASYDNTVRLGGISSDGPLLASASYDHTVRLWDPKTGATVQTVKGHTNPVTAVAFSPDGQLLASASNDDTVRLWDPKTGTTVQTLKGHTNPVIAVVFSPDGQLLASASYDNTVRLWDPKTGATVQTLKGHTNWVLAVAFSSNGQLLASASWDDTVRLWDPKTGATVQTLKGHTNPVTAVAFSPDGQLLASASYDDTVRLWDPKTGATVQTLKGHTDDVTAVAFSPDGQLLALASYDKTVRLWDTTTGVALQTLEVNMVIQVLSFSVDGSCLRTDNGLFDITTPLLSPGVLLPRPGLPHDIFIKEQWVVRGKENLLWLPSEYRPASVSCVAVREGVMALGHTSGRISFLEFALA